MSSGLTSLSASNIGPAATDVATAWDARMWQEIRRGSAILALRGAGSVNGMDPRAADAAVEDGLIPQIEQDMRERPVVIVYDGDPDNSAKPDIGYVAGRLLDRFGNNVSFLAAQTDDWYYPPGPGSNLVNSQGLPYETFVIKRGQHAGDHSRLTQSPQLAAYPGYRQFYIGAAGTLANEQMVSYCRAVPEGNPVNVTVIKASINHALSKEIGLKLASAVTAADQEKFLQMQEQRRDIYGKQWNRNGEFNAQLLEDIRHDTTHELAVLWDVHSRVGKVDIVNCLKLDLGSAQTDQTFARAPYYAKTKPIMARQIPAGAGEWINVKSGATGDHANPGDWVCRKQRPSGKFGEEYVVHQQDFSDLYERTDAAANIFRPKPDPRKLVQVQTDVIFMAPWGEKQAIRRGGYLMERIKKDGTIERYGISQQDAEADFQLVQ